MSNCSKPSTYKTVRKRAIYTYFNRPHNNILRAQQVAVATDLMLYDI